MCHDCCRKWHSGLQGLFNPGLEVSGFRSCALLYLRLECNHFVTRKQEQSSHTFHSSLKGNYITSDGDGIQECLCMSPEGMCPHLGKGISREAVGILCSGLYSKLIQMLMSECQLPPQFTLEYTQLYTLLHFLLQSDTGLVLAGIQVIFFLIPSAVLWFGSSRRITDSTLMF